MIARAAREITPGMTVNLGIGLPTKVVDHLPSDFEVCLHTENGMAGIGPTLPYDRADRQLIDAGGAYVSTVPGSAFFDSVTPSISSTMRWTLFSGWASVRPRELTWTP